IYDEDRLNINKVLAKFKRRLTDEELFYNLCFCICAPQTKFSSNLKVIADLKSKDFFNKNIEINDLTEIIRPVRFLRKAKYLLVAKRTFDHVLQILQLPKDGKFKRNILVKDVIGMGMKAASHFLRNQGYEDLAIIDTHIIKFLKIETFKMNKKGYEIAEVMFQEYADYYNLSIAALDIYLWKIYSKTNWEDFIY
ncbi:MAG: hypothetical protein WC934_14830, partial [Acidithiobacillus sp.]|uniref:8-oxoguanine DNA glycosylase n=1 Tax=Acidithiobacillus sp. TaxID=1872118 RepID=UPI00355CD536